MSRLQIRLLGRFSVASGGEQIEVQASAAHLLAYLALSYGHVIPRTRAAGTLWPDLPEERARANLSTVTWRLRQALASHDLPPEVIFSSNESLSVNTDLCEVDVERFRQGCLGPGPHSLSLDVLARAVTVLELYQGDLLEDWDVEWCLLERENLQRDYLHTLRALAEGFERRARFDLAVQYAKRAVEIDPLNEPNQRALMRLLSLLGEKASAVDQFNRFARLVRSELGVDPERETVVLLEQIRRASPAQGVGQVATAGDPMLTHPDRAALVGRVEERQEILSLLEAAQTKEGGGILLRGEAGIGKSKLAEWVMEEWAARGGATVRGRCVEFNEPVPYQPLLDALESYVDSRDLAEFVGEAGSGLTPLDQIAVSSVSEVHDNVAPWPSGKLRLFNWLRSRLEDESRRRPFMIVIEDLQWADTGTLDFLAYLLVS